MNLQFNLVVLKLTAINNWFLVWLVVIRCPAFRILLKVLIFFLSVVIVTGADVSHIGIKNIIVLFDLFAFGELKLIEVIIVIIIKGHNLKLAEFISVLFITGFVIL